MDKDSFLAFCRSELTKRGFRKYKSMYFLSNQKDILCGIWLKKSNFSPKYTVCYYFFVGLFDSPKEYPTRYDFDFADSIKVMSRVTSKGQRFLTGELEYEHYTGDELLPFLLRLSKSISFHPYIAVKMNCMRIFLICEFLPQRVRTKSLPKQNNF